ncbi:MAG: ATP-binding protein [Betaproteobacteria bacterium]|nr:MAG: ATP-binding protein [Betaproteobacteria bacterium]
MARFIPEWTTVNTRERALKSALGSLSDEHVIRRPLRQRGCVADMFITHPALGWLALAIEDVDYASLNQGNMFDADADARQDFEARMASLRALSNPQPNDEALDDAAIPVLVIMRRCTTQETQQFANHCLLQYGVRVVALERFEALGTKLVERMSASLSHSRIERLMSEYFPEAEIAAVQTARSVTRHAEASRAPKLFLDIEQEWASKLDLEQALPDEQASVSTDLSVRLVNGIAGSGKTLILVNRALMLSELYPEQKILLLIFNTPVVADLKAKLRAIRSSFPENLEIATFHGWAVNRWHVQFGRYPQFLTGRVLETWFKTKSDSLPKSPLTPSQLLDEIDFINHSLIVDEAAYLQVARLGRGFTLRAEERRAVWQCHIAVTQALKTANKHLFSQLAPVLLRSREGEPALARYDHVLIDEAQFFAPSWFELVKHVLRPGAHLFLCADPNQGFLKTRLSWKSAGINVVGRTKRLHKSYRTTRAILESANRLLVGLSVSGDDDYLLPEYAGMPDGERPRLVYVKSSQDAVDKLVELLRDVHGGTRAVRLSATLVIHGDSIYGSNLASRLRATPELGSVWHMNSDGIGKHGKSEKHEPPDGYGKDYLRLVSITTATGLEAAIVFLIGLESLLLGYRPHGMAEEAWEVEQVERRRKLYMAMTRAGQRLVLISADELPIEMESLFGAAH